MPKGKTKFVKPEFHENTLQAGVISAFPQGDGRQRQEDLEAHRPARLVHTGLKQQRDPTSNKVEGKDHQDPRSSWFPHTQISPCIPTHALWHAYSHIHIHECTWYTHTHRHMHKNEGKMKTFSDKGSSPTPQEILREVLQVGGRGHRRLTSTPEMVNVGNIKLLSLYPLNLSKVLLFYFIFRQNPM